MTFSFSSSSEKCFIPPHVQQGGKTQNWLNHGGDLYNRRYAEKETKISPSTASKLRLKWEFYAGRDITATPAIFNGTLYFPSWNGYLYAVKASDGSLIWKKNLQDLTGLEPTATPTVVGDLLITGIYGPAVVIAVERSTGKLVWSTQLVNSSAGVITLSGTYFQGGFYVGTSSLEETLSIEECCVFRGSFFKLSALTGAVLWQTYMLPDNNGSRGEYAGAAIWGSSPSIDKSRNSVFIATGNLYSAPSRILECQERQNNQTTPISDPNECYRQIGGYDVWILACNGPSTNPNCPPGPNPDADFSEAPMMLSIRVNETYSPDIVTAVQKSGFAWTLDRDNGDIVWFTEAGPGSFAGGGYWGAATDKKRVYTNIANAGALNFTLIPSHRNTTAGGWVAMDANSGEILWSTGDPYNATASGPVSVANGVLFGGSTSGRGPIYAKDAKTGHILWSYDDGCIYVGNGYKTGIAASFPSYTAGTSLFAFCIQ
ncbi:hypothetical protein UlMin_014788 [Ulmus minor]